MQHSHHENTEDNNSGSWLFSRTGIATLVAVSILGFLIYEGHGAHLLGYAPFLLILACPLMHIFMHGGHGQHQAEDKQKDSETAKSEKPSHKGGCH